MYTLLLRLGYVFYNDSVLPLFYNYRNFQIYSGKISFALSIGFDRLFFILWNIYWQDFSR